MPRTRGVYFLANDRVLDHAVAFLNSFRAHNPTVALCLVPFAADIDQIQKLQPEYDFAVYSDRAVLRRCDRIGQFFHHRVFGHYRKLAMWEGPFDEFLYLDCDTVILGELDFVFDHLADYAFVTSQSHIPRDRRWVWKDSIDGAGVLSAEQIAFAANTGFVASRREHLPLASVTGKLAAALELADHFELFCAEQPLLNYLMVTSGLPYTSLRALAATTPGPLEWWAGDPGLLISDGRVLAPPTLLVHWAGEWQRAAENSTEIPYRALWEHYRHLR